MESSSFPANEPASTVQLKELPASLENINTKLNHLLDRVEVSVKTGNDAKELAEQARNAARKSGDIALKAIQGIDALPRRERLFAVMVGSLAGGALVSFVVWAGLLAAGTISLSSCLPTGH